MQFFKLDVLYEAPDGGLAVAPPSHIVSQLHSILELAREPNKQPVGILTSEHRDTWYQARECLLQGIQLEYINFECTHVLEVHYLFIRSSEQEVSGCDRDCPVCFLSGQCSPSRQLSGPPG